MDLFLVRHGETGENAAHIIQGWMDTDLNANGQSQAKRAADVFDQTIDAIYCSDLKRTMQTAMPFRDKYPRLPYLVDARLRERNYGEASGQPREKYDWDKIWSAPNNERPIPGAESVDEFDQRVSSFIAELKNTNYKKVLIITHSGTINRFRYLIAGEGRVKNPNGSVAHLVLN